MLGNCSSLFQCFENKEDHWLKTGEKEHITMKPLFNLKVTKY